MIARVHIFLVCPRFLVQIADVVRMDVMTINSKLAPADDDTLRNVPDGSHKVVKRWI